MYNGELSHMENSRRWSCINILFLVMLVLVNVSDGYFRYGFITCRLASWRSTALDCRRGADFKPVWYAIMEVLGQTADTAIPCVLLFSALRRMRASQKDLLSA